MRAAILATALVLVTIACDRRPSDAQLDEWRKRAEDENDAAAATHAAKTLEARWSIGVSGRVKESVRLDWATLDRMATTHVKTRAPHHTANPQQVIDWRVVPLADVLDRAGAAADARTLTFIAGDQYSVRIDAADVRKWPIGIAIEQDGKPIKRSEAGPALVVFPYTEFPDVEKTYDETAWLFYLTQIVVDDEEPRVRVGTRALGADALAKLPHVAVDTVVGFRVHWPSERVKLRGVRLRDVIAAASVSIPEGGAAIVRSKRAALPEDEHSRKIDAADVASCDIVLATTFGDADGKITALMGGPVVLAFGETCRAKYSREPWPVYVEDIEIAPP